MGKKEKKDCVVFLRIQGLKIDILLNELNLLSVLGSIWSCGIELLMKALIKCSSAFKYII